MRNGVNVVPGGQKPISMGRRENVRERIFRRNGTKGAVINLCRNEIGYL